MTARSALSFTAAAISSAKKYWSQNVVVPLSAISAQLSATAGPISSLTSDSSGSRMELYQPSMVRRLWPFERPRNSTITEWVWALTRPGITRWPARSMISSKPDFDGIVSRGPTAVMRPSRAEIHPPANTLASLSTVSTVPPWKSEDPISPQLVNRFTDASKNAHHGLVKSFGQHVVSLNPFRADAAIRSRFESLDASIGPAVRDRVTAGRERTRRDVDRNLGGILRKQDVDAIRLEHGLTVEELMLLARATAMSFAQPPISEFFVGVVGIERETGSLIFGGNLEFVGAHIGNTVHGEGFVFSRAFSRGTSVETICLGEAHPCAHCRQYMSEFAATAQLTLIDLIGHRLTMAELYPWPFDPGYLGERGIVAGEVRNPGLVLGRNELAPDVAARLTELGRRAYVPYGKTPAAIVLQLANGDIVGGAAIESVSFNPTMSPLQAAMIDLFETGYATSD